MARKPREVGLMSKAPWFVRVLLFICGMTGLSLVAEGIGAWPPPFMQVPIAGLGLMLACFSLGALYLSVTGRC